MGKTTRSLLLLLLVSVVSAQAQGSLGFGQWEAHLPYQRGLSITQSPTKVYFATDFSIMTVDKEDNSLEFLSKVEGLSSIGIEDLKYDEGTGFVLVAYGNNELDVITPDGVENFADIRNNLGIIGDKRLNDIHFYKRTAYLSLGFGMVSLNMETLEFGFTTQMGMKVNSATTDEEGILYAATDDGVYSVDLESGLNVSDFANWDFLGEEVGLPLIYEAKDIAFHADGLWLLYKNQVWRQDEGDSFTPVIDSENGEQFRFFSDDGPELMIGSRFPSQNKSIVKYVDANGSISDGTFSCTNYITNSIMDESGRVWYTDEWRGFKFTDGKNGDCLNVTNRSVFSNTTSDLLVDDGKLYVASGGVTEGFSPQFNRNGFYILEEGVWNNYNQGNTPILGDEEFLNVFKIAKSPANGNLFIGSFYSGMIEADLENGEYNLYNSENSSIIGTPGLPSLEKVAGLTFDNENTLWITSYEAAEPLIALSSEGNFHSFTVNSSSRLGNVTVDDFNYKWVQVTGTAGGVLVYDDARSVENPSDDRQRLINTANSNLPSNVVNCITKDLDGTIWLGTGSGPVIFGGDALATDENDNFLDVGGTEIVEEEGILARLLETEDIRAIAVDGGNQKWFGTRNGIFVQSPNGVEKVARFTEDDSPLFSNNIIDMAYDPESGIMYIASDGGIQAYKTNTTGGGRVHKASVYAYPNPVRPEYEGPIAFKGLARDATIKVTDINGQLVHESSALGGQATWDGRDYNGRKVASGVYLVFSNGQEVLDANPDTAITKVLIVR